MNSDSDFLSSSSDEELLNILRRKRKAKVVKERRNHMEELSDSEFFDRFRFTKPTVLTILEHIKDDLTFKSRRNNCLSAIQQLLLTLRFYGGGCMLIAVGDFIGVTKATASRTITKVSLAIARLHTIFIHLPQTEEDIKQMQAGFFKIAKFPKVVGTIDCTHIKIQSPGNEDPEMYRNRKGYFSYNVQTVSSYDLKITDIVAWWPGSSHDLTIFNNSRLKSKFDREILYKNCFLLGDSDYRNSEYLLTPLLHTNDAAQELYNKCHIKTRNTVERQYGVWKRRFPILSLGMRVSTSTVKSIVVATAVLHNIAIDMNDLIPIDEDTINEAAESHQNIEPADNNIRQRLIYNYFNRMV